MILKYKSYLIESLIDSFSKDISIDFEIEGDSHFNDRLNRKDNEVNLDGKTEITKSEIISDIKKSIPQIVQRNLFGNGLNWIPREGVLNKEICISNTKTNLNILLMIAKIKEMGTFKYRFTIKTVMRKPGFIPYSNGGTFLIKVS